MTEPTFDAVLAAREVIAPFLRPTPLIRSEVLSELSKADVWLKLESLQPTGSFKVRGALNAASAIQRQLSRVSDPAARDRPRPAMVTASAGNHGAALGYAARVFGLHTVVFTSQHAPATKLDAIQRTGADLRATAVDYDAAERHAETFARDHGVPYVSPYDHADVIAGAGTTALEIIEALPNVDTLVVPIGGGGLVSGIALAVKAAGSTPRHVIGVEAVHNPALTSALRAGHIVEISPLPTIADGLAGNLAPGSRTFDLVRSLVDEVVTVAEEDIEAAIRLLVERHHLVSEGAGAVGVAALAANGVDLTGHTVAVIVSGGNIDRAKLIGILDKPA